MLLALFLLEAAAGLYLFLPLVGRRNAGVKFYRLILITCGSLTAGAMAAHLLAGSHELAWFEAGILGLGLAVYLLLRYPKRLVFRTSAAMLAAAYVVGTVISFHHSVGTSLVWSVVGSVSSTALLGSVNLAMLLGHWYLVVRGMPIDPLRRLSKAFLISAIVRAAAVLAALLLVPGGFERGEPLYSILIANGIFFWMRVGWGICGPLGLFPMIWGTVKIRSTMAATGILYVAVVAVIIGEVLALYLSAVMHVAL